MLSPNTDSQANQSGVLVLIETQKTTSDTAKDETDHPSKEHAKNQEEEEEEEEEVVGEEEKKTQNNTEENKIAKVQRKN